MENDTINGGLAPTSVQLRSFDPNDIWEKSARDQVQRVLIFVIFALGFAATAATMLQHKYDSGNTVSLVSTCLPSAGFVWELLRFKLIGSMPDERLHELNRFRQLHTRFSLRALPLLFALGVVWADDTRSTLILLYECAEFATVVWLLLTFGLRRAFLKRDRTTIIAAQRFAYG